MHEILRFLSEPDPARRKMRRRPRIGCQFGDFTSSQTIFASCCTCRAPESSTRSNYARGLHGLTREEIATRTRTPVATVKAEKLAGCRGSKLRRQITENSLSVSDRVHTILGNFSGGGCQVLETLWSESESQLIS